MKTIQDLYNLCITEARKCHALYVASHSKGSATSFWQGKADTYSDIAFTLANSFGCVAEEQGKKPDEHTTTLPTLKGAEDRVPIPGLSERGDK